MFMMSSRHHEHTKYRLYLLVGNTSSPSIGPDNIEPVPKPAVDVLGQARGPTGHLQHGAARRHLEYEYNL